RAPDPTDYSWHRGARLRPVDAEEAARHLRPRSDRRTEWNAALVAPGLPPVHPGSSRPGISHHPRRLRAARREGDRSADTRQPRVEGSTDFRGMHFVE